MKLKEIILSGVLALGFSGTAWSQNDYNLKRMEDAIIFIESSNNPEAERYEKNLDKDSRTHLDDTSYGLAQFLYDRAHELELKHPELPKLGDTEQEIIISLKNPEKSRAYLNAELIDSFSIYNSLELAAACHNSYTPVPRNARIQEKLNDIFGDYLRTDGILGKKTKNAIRRFQIKYKIKESGRLDNLTLQKINQIWSEKFPKKEDPLGIVPDNGLTIEYVRDVMKYFNNHASR